MKYLLAIIFIIAILSQSCRYDILEDAVPAIDRNGLWNCNAAQNFDSAKLAAKLTGTWKWTREQCANPTGYGQPINADKDVEVTFASAGTFSVTENSNIVTQGNWALKNVDNGVLGLALDHYNDYLWGRILLCDNEVLFNDSYIDGCDNLFERIK